MLCGPGPQLDVRLCDFGLARTAEFSGLTTANAVLGTPEYMAPEVVTDGHADPRSDIYSLGVVLFEAATGRLPFYGDSPYQLMRQHVDVEAPRARSLAPDLPAAIDDAIARALAKDPLDRFATAEDLARALADDSPARDTAMVPAPTPQPARRTCARAAAGWSTRPRSARIAERRCCASSSSGRRRLSAGHRSRRDRRTSSTPGGRSRCTSCSTSFLPAPSRSRAARRRAPRVPFYVAKGITRVSAAALVERLEGYRVRRAASSSGWPLARRAIRSKVWQTTVTGRSRHTDSVTMHLVDRLSFTA